MSYNIVAPIKNKTVHSPAGKGFLPVTYTTFKPVTSSLAQVCPPVERWATDYMNYATHAYRKLFWKQIEWQKLEYVQEKMKLYPMAANDDNEYLDLFIRNVTSAENIVDIDEKDFEKFWKFLEQKYRSKFYIMRAHKALTCFVRFWRARGYPTYVPSDLKKFRYAS